MVIGYSRVSLFTTSMQISWKLTAVLVFCNCKREEDMQTVWYVFHIAFVVDLLYLCSSSCRSSETIAVKAGVFPPSLTIGTLDVVENTLIKQVSIEIL